MGQRPRPRERSCHSHTWCTSTTATEPAVRLDCTGQLPGTNVTLRGGSFCRELGQLRTSAMARCSREDRVAAQGLGRSLPPCNGEVPTPRGHHSRWLQVKVETAVAHRLPQVSPTQTWWGTCSFQSTAGHTWQVESAHLPGDYHTMEAGQRRDAAM